jgi:aryl carrier-like protein
MGEADQLLGRDEEGEIVIRGPNVTAGYAGNAEANIQSFCEGWFRTGDRGRLDTDGYLFITGRLKEMINRGGENIAPREVDEVLLEHPAVAQATAFAVPHPTLGEDLAAAVVVNPDSEITEQALRDYAFERLADFKVPSRVIFVDQIPKGPTGKLQRIGLHEKLQRQLPSQHEEPQTESETLVTRYFAEVLQREKVGANDNFFAIGGDSLRAMQIVSRVRRDCHLELPIVTVFRKPTPRDLAVEIDRLIQEDNANSLGGILDELEQLTDEEARRLLQGDE